MKKLDSVDPLPWTGERLVTTCRRPMAYEHLHRYSIACGLAKGKRVLDIACGEGYGANLLADFAAKVTGVDRDAATIGHAKRRYRRRNLKFLEGTCSAIPCPDHSFDLIVSFETLEHIAEQAVFLAEIKRVLAPKGILVISSPDKTEYRKISETPNPFHENELSHDGFARLLRGEFKYVMAGKQRLVAGSWIAPDKEISGAGSATSRGWFDGVQIANGVYRGLYSLAFCSDLRLPVINLGVFENYKVSAETWDLLDKFDTPSDLAMRMSSLAEENEKKAQQIAAIQRDNEQKAEGLLQLQRQSEERQRQLEHLRGESEAKSRRLAVLQRRSELKSQRVAQLKERIRQQLQQIGEFEHEDEAKALELQQLQQWIALKSDQILKLQTENERGLQENERLGLQSHQLDEQLKRRSAQLDEMRSELRTVQDEKEKAVTETERLRTRMEQAKEQLINKSNQLIEARWEMLTQRAETLRRMEAAEASAAPLLELQDRLEAATSDRDQLRGMIMALQNDVEQERLNVLALLAELQLTDRRASESEQRSEIARRDCEDAQTRLEALEAKLKAARDRIKAVQNQFYASDDKLLEEQEKGGDTERRFAAALDQLHATQAQLKATQEHLIATANERLNSRKQMALLRDRVSHRLILPFGKSQREVQELTRQS